MKTSLVELITEILPKGCLMFGLPGQPLAFNLQNKVRSKLSNHEPVMYRLLLEVICKRGAVSFMYQTNVFSIFNMLLKGCQGTGHA